MHQANNSHIIYITLRKWKGSMSIISALSHQGKGNDKREKDEPQIQLTHQVP